MKSLAALKDIDDEVVELCDAMNRLPGIQTIESCCGHDKMPFTIWFIVDDLEKLPMLLYYCDSHGCLCHSGVRGWRVEVKTDCAMSPTHFMLVGPHGPEAYEGAKEIAKGINEFVDTGGVEEKENEGDCFRDNEERLADEDVSIVSAKRYLWRLLHQRCMQDVENLSTVEHSILTSLMCDADISTLIGAALGKNR